MNVDYSGINFLVLLTGILSILKLAKVLNWDWLLVLAPLWFPIVAIILLLLFMFLIIKPGNK